MLELKLRIATDNWGPNSTITIPAPHDSCIQRIIDFYVDLVGALIGIAILILTMIIWVVIGPVMRLNSNWWLLIGTYAGLISMNDGFILRNVFHNLWGFEDGLFGEVRWEDGDALSVLLALSSE